MSVATKVQGQVQTASRTKKVSKIVVAQVQELTNLRAEIASLEARKEALTKSLEVEFGKNSTTKTSEFDSLTHNNLDVARMDWRVRGGFNEKTFMENLTVSNPELAELVKPHLGLGRTETVYSVLVSLYK
jgi:hypothetical protein